MGFYFQEFCHFGILNSFFFVCYCVLCVFKFEFGSGFMLLCSSRKHERDTRGAAPAFDAVARASVRVCAFFFFFFADSCQLGLIRVDTARFVPNWLRFVPNWADSAKIGPYRPYRVVSAGGRNRPETVEIGLKTRRSSRNSDLRCVFCLLLSLFYESSILMCFLRIF